MSTKEVMEAELGDAEQDARELLRAILAASGTSRRAVDAKLGLIPGYTSQVLTGRLSLKYRHILGVLNAAGCDPGTFFNLLWGDGTVGRQTILALLFGNRRRGFPAGRAGREKQAGQPGDPEGEAPTDEVPT